MLVRPSLPFLFFIGLVFFQTVPFGIELSSQARAATGLWRSDTLSLIPAATLSSGRRYIALFVLFAMLIVDRQLGLAG